MPSARFLARSAAVVAAGLLAALAARAPAQTGAAAADRLQALLAAYPDHLSHIDGNALVWRDGTRMAIDDGRGPKPHAAWLADPDIKDMLALGYPAGAPASAPAADFDPGRARNARFFDKMYGSCRDGEAARNLTEIAWLPRLGGGRLKATRVNGVAQKLAAVSADLERLPEAFKPYLVPSAGTYACRPIAGEARGSPHGWGIAIDIAIRHADYWRWSRPGPDGRPVWRNRIPAGIVAAFEAQGFIWGGRWAHHDTMHFEYRPELIVAGRQD